VEAARRLKLSEEALEKGNLALIKSNHWVETPKRS
jgi:hypothetical protein